MKRSILITGLGFGLLICLSFGAWSTRSTTLNCAKCLAGKHQTQQALFGIPVWWNTSEQKPDAHAYEEVFGVPCEHIFYSQGFCHTTHTVLGSTVGCGGSNSLIRSRLMAVAATYDAEQRLKDRDLAKETLRFIDQTIPAEIKDWNRGTSRKGEAIAAQLFTHLSRSQTRKDWRAALVAAQGGFTDTSGFRGE